MRLRKHFFLSNKVALLFNQIYNCDEHNDIATWIFTLFINVIRYDKLIYMYIALAILVVNELRILIDYDIVTLMNL